MHSAAINVGVTLRAAAGATVGSALVRWSLTAAALGVVGLLIVVPVANVFYNAIAPGIIDYWDGHQTGAGSWAAAIARGFSSYWDSLVMDPDTRHAILLTLTVAPSAVVLNLLFGLAAAWAIANFRFP